ncbi:MAG: hypothetical protein H6718_04125 [Polyangiaceae bacterium]|nr:hypothetical protein [Polyangiaceae bacterium]
MAQTINGLEFSWSEISLTIGDTVYDGFTEISYSDKLEPAFQYGAGSAYRPRSQTKGKYSCENVKAKMTQDQAADLRAALSAQSASGVSYGTVIIPVITVQFVIAAQPGVPNSVDRAHLHELLNCRYISTADSYSEGPDGLLEDVEFTCFGIRRNGLTLYEDPQS